jgi:Spy/CpxP family protein refolding chaperone
MPMPQGSARDVRVSPIGAVAWVAAVAALLGVASLVLAGQAVSAGRNRWWRESGIQRQLALTPEQVYQLDSIFSRDRGARIELYKKVARLDAELRHMIEIGEADDATVMRLSDELETLRRQQNTRRALMLLAMYKVLTPSQRIKLMSHYRSSPSSHP